MILHHYAIVGLVGLGVLGVGVLAFALRRPPESPLEAPDAWAPRRFGYATVSLVFLAFDMEMIFMYPWAVVYADIGLKALLDMGVFIGLLSAGIAYAWGMGALRWE